MTQTPAYLHTCTQTSRGPGHHGSARPSHGCQSGRPEDVPWSLSGPDGSDSELGHSRTTVHTHTHCEHVRANTVALSATWDLSGSKSSFWWATKLSLTPMRWVFPAFGGCNGAPPSSWQHRHTALRRCSHRHSHNRCWIISDCGLGSSRAASGLSCSESRVVLHHLHPDTAPQVSARRHGSSQALATGACLTGVGPTEWIGCRWRSQPAGCHNSLCPTGKTSHRHSYGDSGHRVFCKWRPHPWNPRSPPTLPPQWVAVWRSAS